LQHLGVSKDWLEDIASGSVFDTSKIKEVEDELSISDDITIPPNSIITSLTKTENGIEISFLTKEEMEMARKLVDTGTNQRHEFVHLEQQNIIEAINADDSLRPEEKSQLIEAIKNEGVHTFAMEAPLSRSSSARVGGSFNQPFWEYLVNRIKSKE